MQYNAVQMRAMSNKHMLGVPAVQVSAAHPAQTAVLLTMLRKVTAWLAISYSVC